MPTLEIGTAYHNKLVPFTKGKGCTDVMYHCAPLAGLLVDLGSDFKVAASQWRKTVALLQRDSKLTWVIWVNERKS